MKTFKFALLLILPFITLCASCNGNNPSSRSTTQSSSRTVTSFDPSSSFNIHDERFIQYIGRHHTEANGEYFAHSLSGFSIDIQVNNPSNKIEGTFIGTTTGVSETKQYAYAILDAKQSTLVEILNGSHKIVLFENIEPGLHEIRFIKRNESQFSSIILNSLSFSDGFKVEEHYSKTPLIEFYGDSITCGYGNLGTNQDPTFELKTEDATKAYTFLTSENLAFRVSSVSFSGIALAKSPFGTKETILDHYTKDGSAEWDFKNETPKIAVINVGTNDNTAYQQCKTQEDKNQLTTAFRRNLNVMLTKIYTANASTHVILAYNMMVKIDQSLVDIMLNAVDNQRDLGKSIYSLEFVQNTAGVHGHPGLDGHKACADKLTNFILQKGLDK